MATGAPGETVPESGIYKCIWCGNEVTCVKGEVFPPCARKCTHVQYIMVRATR
ncbi:MAG: hypothetical protein FJ087_07945 [Deltaproteobacteria bacterium]|nr:hypothetical protein [Deltaproteobacteria bacterium]